MSTIYYCPLILLTCLWVTACGGGGEPPAEKRRAPPAVTVRTAAAEASELSFYDRFPATVTALDLVELRPTTTGYITAVHFKEGDRVRRGQKLYTIDTRAYVANLNQARAGVATSQANLGLAEKNLARYERLAEAEAIALQTLDQARAEVEAHRQSVIAAEAAVSSAETQLDYAYIRAPLTGQTSLNSAKVGTQVAPGQPLLTTISTVDPVGVDFALPQDRITRLADLEKTGTARTDSTFALRLPDGKRYASFGTVYASNRVVDPRTGSLTVRLEYPNEDGVLRSGMSLEVEMLNRQSGRQLTIPARALGEQMGEYYVMVRQDSIARRRRVAIGDRIRDRVIVLDGLEPGTEVVTEGLKSVRDSSRIKLAQSR